MNPNAGTVDSPLRFGIMNLAHFAPLIIGALASGSTIAHTRE